MQIISSLPRVQRRRWHCIASCHPAEAARAVGCEMKCKVSQKGSTAGVIAAGSQGEVRVVTESTIPAEVSDVRGKFSHGA